MYKNGFPFCASSNFLSSDSPDIGDIFFGFNFVLRVTTILCECPKVISTSQHAPSTTDQLRVEDSDIGDIAPRP
jgi:hypothetical protein